MTEPNEPLLNEHLAAENEHDLARIMATYSASPVIELNGSRIEGTAAVREFHRGFGFGGSEDASFSDVHVAERRRHRTGDAIIIEQTLTVVHTGIWRGIAPTGRAVSVAVCTVYEFEDGKLARENVYLDEGRVRHLLTKPER
jgi:ketosteroid isomerase-like protein